MREGWKSNPHGRLIRALTALAGEGCEIHSSISRRWASATFSGARHEAELAWRGKGAHRRAEDLADRLPEAEFALAGHIVADMNVEALGLSREGGEELALLKIAALTVEDW